MNKVDLSGLRDIHLPIQPTFWPLAQGWYVLLAIIISILLIVWFWRFWYPNRPLPYALKELKKIENMKDNSLKSLSQLLKRVAMAKYGRKKIAPLSEDSWQSFLLSAAPETFTEKQAHSLAFAVYGSEDKIQDASIYKKANSWIKTILKKKNKSA